jgi:hypothetical protein
VRRAWHGEWFDGYLKDILFDPDREIITAMDSLPANVDESANAAELVRQEKAARGNDIEALSIDAVAFQGPVVRELQDPEGLDLDLYVPASSANAESTCFGPEEFSEDIERGELRCPAGNTTTRRKRNRHDTGWQYSFPAKVCADGSLQSRRMAKPPRNIGRSVTKNEYEAEYRRMRAKAQTSEFAAVRKEHRKVERKLAELVRWHGGRRTRYRGRWKVRCGDLMIGMVVNVKRIVHLLTISRSAAVAIG